MSAVVSRRSLLGWLAALPLASAAPKLAAKAAPALAKVEPVVTAALKEFGLWQDYAMHHFVRAYHLEWSRRQAPEPLQFSLAANGTGVEVRNRHGALVEVR